MDDRSRLAPSSTANPSTSNARAPVDLQSSAVMTRAAQSHPIGTPQRSLRAPVLQIQRAINVPVVMNNPTASP